MGGSVSVYKRRGGILLSLVVLSLCFILCLELWRDGIAKDLLRLTHVIVERPKKFGIFHCLSLAVCVALGGISCVLGRRMKREKLDTIIFYAGLLLLSLEIYKQTYYHYILGTGGYNFGVLPLQFCSYDLYIFLIIPFLREGRVKNTLYLFAGLYQTMGGCIVMAYPILYSELALSVHTMLWHTVMISVGILILTCRSYGSRYLAEMLPPTCVFLGVMSVAVMLNYFLYPLSDGSPMPLNLFYISPYVQSNYIIIGDVQRLFGWFPSVITYALLFIFVGSNVVWSAARIMNMKKD